MIIIVANGTLTVLYENWKGKIVNGADLNKVFLNQRNASYDFNQLGMLIDRNVHTTANVMQYNDTYSAISVDASNVKTYVGNYQHKLDSEKRNLPGTRTAEWICGIDAARLSNTHLKIYNLYECNNESPIARAIVEATRDQVFDIENFVYRMTLHVTTDNHVKTLYRASISLDDLYYNLEHVNKLDDLRTWTYHQPVRRMVTIQKLSHEQFLSLVNCEVSD